MPGRTKRHRSGIFTVNRQIKRMQAKQEREADKKGGTKKSARARAQSMQAQGAKRAGPRQFVREVLAEMRKVLWPTKQQVINSFVVVVVVVVVLTAFVFGLDQGFSQLVKLIYG